MTKLYLDIEGVTVWQLPKAHRLQVDSFQLECYFDVNEPESEADDLNECSEKSE